MPHIKTEAMVNGDLPDAARAAVRAMRERAARAVEQYGQRLREICRTDKYEAISRDFAAAIRSLPETEVQS